ncbi:methylisocitrate lyase [Tersicoccus sp. MR15.9]|uniref:methylisocitrate lyase n=1 Tax=Tersicoccus mangrovi TaxID=3121635 RepID=UPI002FE533E7
MLYSTTTPQAKRATLREMLVPGAARQFPGAFNPLSARLIEQKGFDGVYISGAVLANDLGLPDIGLTTLTEVATRAGQIARMTDLPALVDADTGFGEPMNVARTVQELENAGLAGCHIEDQINPKRCGHLDGKAVVDTETALKRIKAAADGRRDENFLIMARTDIRALDAGPAGLAAAVERAKALVDAGADAIFPEAMASVEEFAAICEAVDVPVLANMTEFGKSDLFTRSELADAGVAMIIYPVTLLRIALGAAERALDTLTADGTQDAAVPDMATRARLYDLVDYEAYNRFDTGVFNFQVPGTSASGPTTTGGMHG